MGPKFQKIYSEPTLGRCGAWSKSAMRGALNTARGRGTPANGGGEGSPFFFHGAGLRLQLQPGPEGGAAAAPPSSAGHPKH